MNQLLKLILLITAVTTVSAYDYYTVASIGSTCNSSIALGIPGINTQCLTESVTSTISHSYTVQCSMNNAYYIDIYNGTTCDTTELLHTYSSNTTQCITDTSSSLNQSISHTVYCNSSYNPIGTINNSTLKPVIGLITDSTCNTTDTNYVKFSVDNGICHSYSFISLLVNCISSSSDSEWIAQLYTTSTTCNNNDTSIIFSGMNQQCLLADSAYNIPFGMVVDCTGTMTTGNSNNFNTGAAYTITSLTAVIISALTILII